jgi:hypothetical protein
VIKDVMLSESERPAEVISMPDSSSSKLSSFRGQDKLKFSPVLVEVPET